MLPEATAGLYVADQRRVAALLGLLHKQWWSIGDDLDAGWVRVGPTITNLTAAAQVGAATDGVNSVPAALAQSGFPGRPVVQIDPAAFGGWANLAPYGDGSGLTVPLERHLYGAVIRARTVDAATLEDRLLAGQYTLDRAVHTQIVDAARSAEHAVITATPRAGYIRYVNPPCCQDCAVQAGRWFRWNTGFDRHPNCDCVHRPASEMEPPAGYTQDVPIDQIKDLTVGQRMALEDGGDLSQVVNAYRRAPLDDKGRKIRTQMGDYTLEGTTRQGWHAYVQRELAKQRGEILAETATRVGQRGYIQNYVVRRTGPRPTPDAIYRFAASREEAVRLLYANGYVTGNLQQVARAAAGL